jgi:hypothetical protein
MYDENKPTILLQKGDATLLKHTNSHFQFLFMIQNNSLHLEKIINFDLIKLIYDLNSDIYEKIVLDKKNENESEIIALMKPLFEDIGMPQRYVYFNVNRCALDDGSIIFHCIPNYNDIKHSFIPEEAEMLPLKKILINCKPETPHKFNFEVDIHFIKTFFIPPYAEKITTLVINKIFIRVKEFIEKITL